MEKKRNKQERMELRKSKEFRSTNEIWNTLSLNHSWSIGYLTKLFRSKKFKTYEEWEEFYFNSGEDRISKIKELPVSKQETLKDFSLKLRERPESVGYLTYEEVNLNKHMGRRDIDLCKIGEYMHKEIERKGNKLNISLVDCVDFVRIRVLDEISIGIEREINTIKKLQSFYPKLRFEDVTVEFDAKYCVDYEVYDEDVLILALQIKSDGYKHNKSKTLKETKSFNLEKNKKYTKKFGVDVLYVYSRQDGYIEDFGTIRKINKYIKKSA